MFVNIESIEKCAVEIIICDLLGRPFLRFEKNLQEKMNVIELPLDSLLSGNYLIKVYGNTGTFVEKFTVKK